MIVSKKIKLSDDVIAECSANFSIESWPEHPGEVNLAIDDVEVKIGGGNFFEFLADEHQAYVTEKLFDEFEYLNRDKSEDD